MQTRNARRGKKTRKGIGKGVEGYARKHFPEKMDLLREITTKVKVRGEEGEKADSNENVYRNDHLMEPVRSTSEYPNKGNG